MSKKRKDTVKAEVTWTKDESGRTDSITVTRDHSSKSPEKRFVEASRAMRIPFGPVR